MQIMKRVSAVLPGRTPRSDGCLSARPVAHFAFGAGAGALYGLLAPRRFREGTGIAYAGLIWVTSYLGWLPALRLHPPVARDDRVRQIGNAAGHVVYGISLAEGMRLTRPR